MGKWNPAVLAISGYQQYISPHKGFCCAHRVATGDLSCSEYVKRQIQSKGLFRSLKAMFFRFAECKKSAIYLNGRKQEEKKKADAACLVAESLACLPTSIGEASCGSVAGIGAGGCDGCACTPF